MLSKASGKWKIYIHGLLHFVSYTAIYKYIHWFGFIEECLNLPKYCSIWSSHTRIFMIYESFFTKNNVLSNICLVYIENNCFVSKRGLSQVKIESSSHLWHSSDIEFCNDFVNDNWKRLSNWHSNLFSNFKVNNWYTSTKQFCVCPNVPLSVELIVCW